MGNLSFEYNLMRLFSGKYSIYSGDTRHTAYPYLGLGHEAVTQG